MGKYCTTESEILQSEGRWLNTIIFLQLGKALVFSIWQVYVAWLDGKLFNAKENESKEEIDLEQGPSSKSNSSNASGKGRVKGNKGIKEKIKADRV